jgi:hypothetical protein
MPSRICTEFHRLTGGFRRSTRSKLETSGNRLISGLCWA